jgi:hypothetical protein
MNKVTLAVDVNKSVSELFAFAINPANTPKWIDSIMIEETNEWPIKLGTIYRNRGESGEWSEYTVTALKENELFELTEKDGNYRVRYVFTSLSSTSSQLEYSELVENGEIEKPFTQEILNKLKFKMEESL